MASKSGMSEGHSRYTRIRDCDVGEVVGQQFKRDKARICTSTRR